MIIRHVMACFLLLGVVGNGCAPRVDDTPIDPSRYPGVIRVACVGDSITACDTCWPTVLAKKLGGEWEIANFGLGCSTVLMFGDTPYVPLKMGAVLAYRPDVVIILLGTNDSKPRHWYYREIFEQHYEQMLFLLQDLESAPRIWVCLPPPAFPGQWGIDDGRIQEMLPVIRRVAKSKGVPVIDLYTPLKGHSELFPDQIHPNPDGTAIIVAHIYRALTGRDHAGMP